MARKSRKNNDISNDVVSNVSRFTIHTAFYIRLSVEDNKNRGNSIEHQQMLLRNFVAVNPEFQVVKTYIDNGKTGTNFERPAFQEMIQNIEAGKIQCVIVKDLSRLGRNYIDTGYYIQSYFPAYKVRFIALNENFDTEKEDSNNILLPVLNMINESYALDTSKKIKEQATRDRKAGKFIGARPPYGYKKSPDDCHKLMVDEETAPIVKQIFQWVLEDVSLEKIALMLNEAGVLTPSFYSKEKGLISNKKLIGQSYWNTFTIIHIIENETYTGDMVQGKSTKIGKKQVRTDKKDWIIVKNTHEAIISKETFEKVQQCRMQYQSEIENLLSKITCLEEIQQYNSQKIEHILKLKEVFQSTQISEITKEFANKLIKRVEVSPTGAVDVIFYFDELLNEIEVNDIE